MTIISALIGLIAGIILTLLSEIVKRASQKRVSATKLYTDILLLTKELLESDLMSFAGLAKIVYQEDSFKDVGTSSKKLTEYLEKVKKDMLNDSQRYYEELKKLKEDPHHLEKYIALFELYESKYKSDSLVLTKNEISYLAPGIQPAVIELIENQFQCVFHFKYFLIRLKNEEINTERSINDFIDCAKYMTKIYKDRKIILDYSRKLSKKSFVQTVFDGF